MYPLTTTRRLSPSISSTTFLPTSARLTSGFLSWAPARNVSAAIVPKALNFLCGSADGTSMSIAWSGALLPRATCNLGPLAVVAPLLEQMDVAAIIDRHLPPDPQLEYSHGQVLRLLLGALVA